MEKKLVWVMGAMASGKSTQRKLLCERLSDGIEGDLVKKQIGDLNVIYTSYGDLVGMPGKASTNQCDGLDSSFGAMKKVGSLKATEICIKKHSITIVEGSQTTFTWVDALAEMCEKHNCEFYIVHLYLDDEIVIDRLVHRNEIKGTEVTDKKIKNVLAKNNQYFNIYEKIKDRKDINKKRVHAKKSIEKVFDDIVDFIFED